MTAGPSGSMSPRRRPHRGRPGGRGPRTRVRRPVKHPAAGLRCVFGVSEADPRWEVDSREHRPRPGLQGEDPDAGRGEDPPRCGGRDREAEAGSGAEGEEPGAAGSQPLAPRAPTPGTWNFRLLQRFGPSARSRSQRRPPSLTLDRNPWVRTAAAGSADLEPLLRVQAVAALPNARPPPPALPMHLPGCGPAMADASFSLAGHLLRSPGGSTSRLHSIEAILGFTKDEGILGSFPMEAGAQSAKERERRPGARAACTKMPGGGAEPSQQPAPAPAPEYEGECAFSAAARP